MIRNNTKKRMWSIIPIMLIAGGVFFASCNDNIVVGSVDETPYILSGESFGYLKDVTTSRTEIPVKVTNSIDLKVSFGLSKATGETVSATLAADTTLVQTYNETNNKAYKAFPADQVTIAGNGVLSVGQWKTASNPLTVSLAKGALSNGTYLLPITVKESATVKITESLKTLYYVIEVADVFTPGSTAKPGGVKTLCYVEVGNANANMLNVGAYVLKDSGIPFFDIAVVFAANIKYDVATGEVSLVYNESVGHILRNRDTYIKPLQDKGIKVILGVVGNWDFAGVANLQGDVLRNYAKQCQIAIDTYGLDGIDFDDEWSTY
ncbi:MAG: DUF1735 domain-containing protein, partial [Prevotellaceae bacterium]|nr:DUF1735 domain-containing protein [Prevotellaceae bacterium]